MSAVMTFEDASRLRVLANEAEIAIINRDEARKARDEAEAAVEKAEAELANIHQKMLHIVGSTAESVEESVEESWCLLDGDGDWWARSGDPDGDFAWVLSGETGQPPEWRASDPVDVLHEVYGIRP